MEGGHVSTEHKTLVRRWFDEVWNKGRAAAIDEMLVERGKLVEGWNSFDQLGMLQQLGVVNLPSAV